MSNCPGCDCQKSRTPIPKPPPTSLSEQKPADRVPPEIPTQPCPAAVRLRSSKPSADNCVRVKSFHAGIRCRRSETSGFHCSSGGVGSPPAGLSALRRRIAAKARQSADGLHQEPAVRPGKPYVPIVQFAGQGDREPHAQAGQEVFFNISVPHERVHHAHAPGAGEEVETNSEGEPFPPWRLWTIRTMPAVQPHHSPHGPALFHRRRLEVARESFPARAAGASAIPSCSMLTSCASRATTEPSRVRLRTAGRRCAPEACPLFLWRL